MKLALVSTPRSGNIWLRDLLAQAHGLRQHAVHLPEDLDRCNLPDDCIVQMHWHRTPEFLALLHASGGPAALSGPSVQLAADQWSRAD